MAKFCDVHKFYTYRDHVSIQVVALFPEEARRNTFLWKSENETFPIFTKMLLLDDYRYRNAGHFIISWSNRIAE